MAPTNDDFPFASRPAWFSFDYFMKSPCATVAFGAFAFHALHYVLK